MTTLLRDGTVFSRYEGKFHENKEHGTGKLTFVSDELCYEGGWHQGAPTGNGELTYGVITIAIIAPLSNIPTTMGSKIADKPTCIEAYIAQQYN